MRIGFAYKGESRVFDAKRPAGKLARQAVVVLAASLCIQPSAAGETRRGPVIAKTDCGPYGHRGPWGGCIPGGPMGAGNYYYPGPPYGSAPFYADPVNLPLPDRVQPLGAGPWLWGGLPYGVPSFQAGPR